SPGQEIAIGWVITDAFIADHGMTGTWVSFNGQWKPFFRRKIKWLDTSVTPNKVYVDVPLRYPALVRDSASIRPLTLSPSVHGYLKECGLEDLAVTNASTASCAATYDQVQAITFQDTEDCWVRNVQSFASPNPGASGFHLQSGGIDIESSNRVTVTNCQMQKAQNKGSGGNGYLFQVTRSNEVLFTDCTALEGRHNFIQNWDFGTTGCVWHRCHTANGDYLSEYHHSLSMACLVDCCIIDDGWQGGNRQDWSSGAGHTVTQSCYWNNTGTGWIGSWNYGWGYVIGTAPGMIVQTGTWLLGESLGTEPWDYTEGLGQGATLDPPCLFDDQLARRMANSIRRSSWEIYQ
ncbi:hypothetical protein HY256_09000, partial [Candidatus Sumerlaeota bacterium]|nr:hypothetical protein [Candidatus Sumerlaeota bacterium]